VVQTPAKTAFELLTQTTPIADHLRPLVVARNVDWVGYQAAEKRLKMTDTIGPIQPVRARLTRKAVETAIAAHRKGVRRRLWDSDLPTLYLHITPAGSPSYCLRYPRVDGSSADFTIGSAKVLTPEMARESAKSRLGELIVSGTDPAKKRRADREAAGLARTNTFQSVASLYLEKKEMRPTTFQTRKCMLMVCGGE